MAEEKTEIKQGEEKKEEKIIVETKTEGKHEENNLLEKGLTKKEEKEKKEEHKENNLLEKGLTKKEEKGKKPEKARKIEAIVNGKDLGISTKHAMAICKFIKGKKLEEALYLLEQISKKKIALPMKGEIPHRKGKMMSGRYPVNALKEFIRLLKLLNANASVAGVEIDNAKIVEAFANRASRPHRRFGNTRFKRTHVLIKLQEKKKK